MVKEFYEVHSEPAGTIFVSFDSEATADLAEWLSLALQRDLLSVFHQPRTKFNDTYSAGDVRPMPDPYSGNPYLPKKNSFKSKDDLLVEAQAWRARYQTSSPYIGFQ